MAGYTESLVIRVVGVVMFAPPPPFRFRALQSSKRGLWDKCFVCEATAGLLRARRGPETGVQKPKQCASAKISSKSSDSESPHGCLRGILRSLDCKPLRGQCDTWDRQVSDVHPLLDARDNLYTPPRSPCGVDNRHLASGKKIGKDLQTNGKLSSSSSKLDRRDL